jgi:hypothetical protein
MTYETALYSLLSGVCPNAYPDTAPNDPPLPFVVWQQIGGAVINQLASALPSHESVLIQVSVWANTRKVAVETSRAIEAAMLGTSAFIARSTNNRLWMYNEDTEWRGCSQDFRIWATQ